MSKRSIYSAVILSVFAMCMVGGPAVALDRAPLQTASSDDSLGNDLIVIVGAAKNDDSTLEGRLALRLAQANKDCPTTLAAITRAYAMPNLSIAARRALLRLRRTAQQCNSGTGAIAGTGRGIGAPAVQSFSVGGGSDYTP